MMSPPANASALEGLLKEKISDHFNEAQLNHQRILHRVGPDFEKIYTVKRPDNVMEFRPDVVIAGAGPAGMLMGAYLSLKGQRILVFDKGEADQTTRAWNISNETLLVLKELGVFTGKDIADIKRPGFEHGMVHYCDPETGLLNFYDFDGCLETHVVANALLRKARSIIERNHGMVLYGHLFQDFKAIKNDEYKYVKIKNKNEEIVIETRLFYSAMGYNDPLFSIFNPDKKTGRKYYNVVGVDLKLTGNRASFTKNGQRIGIVGGTISNANTDKKFQDSFTWYPYQNNENEIRHVIYRITLSKRRGDLGHLADNLFSVVRDYIQLIIPDEEIDFCDNDLQLLYGHIPLNSKSTKKTISPVDGLMFGGENAGVSPLTGCGLTSIVQNLGQIGKALDKRLSSVSRNALSQKSLNKIKMLNRHEISWSIQAPLSDIFEYQEGEPADRKNRLANRAFSTVGHLDKQMVKDIFNDRIRIAYVHKVFKFILSRDPGLILDILKNNAYSEPIGLIKIIIKYFRLLRLDTKLMCGGGNRGKAGSPRSLLDGEID